MGGHSLGSSHHRQGNGEARADRPVMQPSRKLRDEQVVVGASGFTSLWAITWMGAEAMAVNTAVAGGFAVGGVMASSGLALLWWRTRTMRDLRTEHERREAESAEHDPSSLH